jgi:hypothetical protein
MSKEHPLTPHAAATLVDLGRAPTHTDRALFEAASIDVQFVTLAFLREQQEINLPGTSVPILGFGIAAFALSVPVAIAIGNAISSLALQSMGIIILLAVIALLLAMRRQGDKTDQARASAVVWYQALMGDLPIQRPFAPVTPLLREAAVTVHVGCNCAPASEESGPELDDQEVTAASHSNVARGGAGKAALDDEPASA